MTGVKGKSGGYRPGAGRKPSVSTQQIPLATNTKETPQPPTKLVPVKAKNLLDLLEKVAFGKLEVTSLQVRAAIAAVQYKHKKADERGKKDERKVAAAKVTKKGGKFAPAEPPRLVINNR